MADLEPITREEHYLSAIAGLTELPSDMTPITREEMFLQEILDNGGGGGEATGTKEISITENGVTTHNIKAYATAEITTNVPNPSTGTKQINANGTHDVTDYASAQVNVPNSYSASDEGKVVDDGALVSQTSKNITSNGTVDTTLNNSVVVNVSNSYSASDEGKVVSNGALVAQTSQNITANDTYDTTLINEVVVNVASSGGVEFTWNTVDVITIGANSVSNTQEAQAYFSSYSYDIILLLEQPTVNNQICTFITGQPTRYRNGAVGGVSVGTAYDAYVVEGTKYLILKH